MHFDDALFSGLIKRWTKIRLVDSFSDLDAIGETIGDPYKKGHVTIILKRPESTMTGAAIVDLDPLRELSITLLHEMIHAAIHILCASAVLAIANTILPKPAVLQAMDHHIED